MILYTNFTITASNGMRLRVVDYNHTKNFRVTFHPIDEANKKPGILRT